MGAIAGDTKKEGSFTPLIRVRCITSKAALDFLLYSAIMYLYSERS